MSYHLKILLIALLVTGSFLVFGGKSLSSKAYAIPGNNGAVCSSKGSGLCLKYVSGNIYTEPYSSSAANEESTKTDYAVCNGGDKVITSPSGCPFNNGSGLNSTYKGSTIVFITLGDECVGSDPASDAVPRACPTDEGSTGGTGIEWVEAGQYALINKYDSNIDNTAQYLCSQGGSGDFVITKAFSDNSCQWSYK